MEFSGPATLPDLHVDLALSEDANDDPRLLPRHQSTTLQSQQPAVSASSEFEQILEPRRAAATLISRYKSMEERYDAFEARLVDLIAKQAFTNT